MSDERDEPVDSIEPELRQATPRSIRIRQVCKINRLATLALIIVLPGIAAAVGFYQQSKWDRLKSRGAEAIGVMNEKQDRKEGKRSRPPRGFYRYEVKGTAYRYVQNFSDEEFPKFALGHRRTIVYLPEQPSYASTHEALDAQSFAAESLAIWAVGAGVGLVLLGSLSYSEWLRARRVRLARYGTAVVATSLEYEPAAINSFNKRWKITYSFAHRGTEFSGQGTYRGKSVPSLLQQGVAHTILFDPDDPRRSEPYAAVKQWVQATSAE